MSSPNVTDGSTRHARALSLDATLVNAGGLSARRASASSMESTSALPPTRITSRCHGRDITSKPVVTPGVSRSSAPTGAHTVDPVVEPDGHVLPLLRMRPYVPPRNATPV